MDINTPLAEVEQTAVSTEQIAGEDHLQSTHRNQSRHSLEHTAVPHHESGMQSQNDARGDDSCLASSSTPEPVDKLNSQVKIVLHQLTPTTCGFSQPGVNNTLGTTPFRSSEDKSAHKTAIKTLQGDVVKTDKPSRKNRSTGGSKQKRVNRGIQANLLCAEVCTETTDEPAPQYIVDEEAILQLLKTCPLCNKQCRYSKYSRGPYFIVYQSCYFCYFQRKWASQPEARNIKIRKTRTLPKKSKV